MTVLRIAKVLNAMPATLSSDTICFVKLTNDFMEPRVTDGAGTAAHLDSTGTASRFNIPIVSPSELLSNKQHIMRHQLLDVVDMILKTIVLTLAAGDIVVSLAINGKAKVNHGHSTTDVTELHVVLSSKSSVVHMYTTTIITDFAPTATIIIAKMTSSSGVVVGLLEW